MTKISLLFTLIFSFLQAETLSLTQQKVYDEILNKKEMREVLLQLPRENRKAVCLKIMNLKDDPILSYKAANCLLYNGYGELSIPLFTEYLYNGYNEKYLNKRMGYGWLHSADWYKVGEEVLSTMTAQEALYPWIEKRIQEEILKHPNKYGERAIADVIKKQFIQYTKEHPLNDLDKQTLKSCQNITLFFYNYTCHFDKKEKKFSQCKKESSHHKHLISCIK